ncbi:MAG: hypothetical protein WC356_01570 [Candidatus Micrarchaeia archaeon]|jgi:hypothetical protein
MTQGTISIICGCHSPVHSLMVIRAWQRLYGKLPSWRETICIFLHDVGHFGLNYLNSYEEKKTHWRAGARIGGKLFGEWAYDLLAGHCTHSGQAKSKLYFADKLSWHLAPKWWLWLNTIFEPKLAVNCVTRMDAVMSFKAQVRESIQGGHFKSTHSFYLERLNGGRK